MKTRDSKELGSFVEVERPGGTERRETRSLVVKSLMSDLHPSRSTRSRSTGESADEAIRSHSPAPSPDPPLSSRSYTSDMGHFRQQHIGFNTTPCRPVPSLAHFRGELRAQRAL